MKTLLLTLPLSLMFMSCYISNDYDKETGDFTNYYNQYRLHETEENVEKIIQDSLVLIDQSLVNK